MYKNISTNNLQTYLVELPKKIKRWQIKLDISAGYLSAPKNKREIPHLLEHYLIRCLKKAKLDSWATTDVDSLVFHIDLPSKNAVKKLTSFLTILLKNKIDNEAIFSLDKKIWKNEYLGNLDNPETLSRRIAINNLINNKPYAIDNAEISFSDIQDFYYHSFLTSKMYLFIGANQIKAMPIAEINKVIALFDNLTYKQLKVTTKYLAPKKVTHFLDTNRTNICLAWPAPHQSDPPVEHIGIMLIAELLCDVINGILWEVLQEKRGLVYDLEYYVNDCSSFGCFLIQVATLNEDALSCIETISAEIDNLIAGKITQSRLTRLINLEKTDNKRRWANNEARFIWVADDLKSIGRVNDLDIWLHLYEKITPALLIRIAKKYLTNNLQIIKTGKNVSPPR